MAQKIREAEGLLRVIPKPGETMYVPVLPHEVLANPGARHSLPADGENNVLITSALPYCNNVPHLGTFTLL